MQLTLNQLYEKMQTAMGPSGWWPADSKEEIIIGAILIQNTNWRNADRALGKLREATALDPDQILALSRESLQSLVKPAGFFKNKSKALVSVLSWLQQYDYDYPRICHHFGASLRSHLLKLRGVGPETADVLLTYIFDVPTFISDKYARTLFTQLGVPGLNTYQDLAHYWSTLTDFTPEMAQDFHGLIDEFGKVYFHPASKFKESFLAGDTLVIH